MVLLTPLFALGLAALTFRTALVAVRALLLISRDLAQTRFSDGTRKGG